MIRTRRRDELCGQSLVEFALILPIFVLVLVGIFDVGRAVFAYNTVNNAARQGARLAIVDQTVAHIQTAASDAAATLGLGSGDVTVTFHDNAGPASPCTSVQPGDDDNGVGMTECTAVVEVRYGYTAATPIIGQLVGPMTITGTSSFNIGFNCEGPECPYGD